LIRRDAFLVGELPNRLAYHAFGRAPAQQSHLGIRGAPDLRRSDQRQDRFILRMRFSCMARRL
jgi:hypothetical protein